MRHRLGPAATIVVAAIGVCVTSWNPPPATAQGAARPSPFVAITTAMVYSDASYANVGLRCANAPCSGAVSLAIDGSSPDTYDLRYSLRAGSSRQEFVRLDPLSVELLIDNGVLPGTASASVIGGQTAMRSVQFVYSPPAVYPTATWVDPSGIVETDVVCRSEIPCGGLLFFRVALSGHTHLFTCQFSMGPQDIGHCEYLAQTLDQSRGGKNFLAQIGVQGDAAALPLDDVKSLFHRFRHAKSEET